MVVGSGIMGERLAGGNDALTLLANSLATGAGLSVLILVFEPLSGAHFNPAVTLVAALGKKLPPRRAASYIGAQVLGAYAGTACAHLMFETPVFAFGTHARSGWAQCGSEFVAAFGLLLVILACARNRPNTVPYAVGAYITSAYWFTASTSFANPAVTLARAFTDTFSGIAPADILGFIAAQAAGALTAWALFRWLYGHKESLLPAN